MSKETIDYHYDHLAKGYAKRYNADEGNKDFNRAGSFLHNKFFPQLRAPKGANRPKGAVAQLIEDKFKTWEDFKDEFKVLSYGYFSNDEWVYVLIKRRPSSADTTTIETEEFTEFSNLFFTREQEISTLVDLRSPIVIYGAAGKGIVLGYSLVKAGISDVFAVDADPNRQGLYMECSGVPVVGTNEVTKILSSDVLILVANPNHFSYVVNRFKHSLIKRIGNLMTL
jgi:hypothetical protein